MNNLQKQARNLGFDWDELDLGLLNASVMVKKGTRVQHLDLPPQSFRDLFGTPRR